MPERARTAIVTGAAQGLGRAIADELYACGHNVALVDVDEDQAASAAKELDPAGSRAAAFACDVRSRDDLVAMFDSVAERWDEPQILVNNAARSVMRSFWDIEPDEWDDVMAVNLRSVYLGCQIAGTRMRETGWGRIVNMSSIAGQQGGVVMGAHYAASKAAIVVVTKIVASELAGTGVTVNALAPAAIDSPLLRALGEDKVAAMSQKIPVGRIGQPEEVAALTAFIASERGAYMTGTTVDINGGLFMR